MDKYKILKFLFPEYQIIESIKKYGFIAKKKSTLSTQQNAFQNITTDKQRVQNSTSQNPPSVMSLPKKQYNTKAAGDTPVLIL